MTPPASSEALTPTFDPPRRWLPRTGPGRALLISLLLHALLLSLTFGGEGLGLPGLSLPWMKRRAEVPDLRVVLVQPRPDPAPTEPPADAAPSQETEAHPATSSDEAPPQATLGSDAAAPAVTRPALIAVDRPAPSNWAVPNALPASAPVIASFNNDTASPTAVSPLREAGDNGRTRLDREARDRTAELASLDRASQEAQQEARQQALRLEAARLEAERQELARQEAARQEAARREAARVEAARQEAERQEVERQAAARAEAARAEAERQEAMRRAAAQQDAARQEAQRQEAARQDAQRQEAARQEAARQEAARQDAARAEAARQAAAKQEAARLEAARAEAAKLEAAKLEAKAAEEQREARLRAIGQQLNEEAARRDAARQAQPNLPSSWSSLRRGRLWGRTDANAEMVLYAEAWARKIQLGQSFDLVRDAIKAPYTDPLVTVAIRADGTVESVSFYRSSGVPALDDAIRRVIEAQANYPAFTPALAREYDVIEIRRTWHFDTAIRLY